MSEELKDYEGKLSQVTKTLQTEQQRVAVAEGMLLEKRTEWENQHRESEKEHHRLVEQVKEMTGLIESLEQEITDLRAKMSEHETQLRLGKAGEDEVNILRGQVDALTEDVTRLGLREKQLMAEMKKKGDLARQMLVEKDKLIHSLQQGQGGLGGGGGIMSTTPSSLPPSTPTNDNNDKVKEKDKDKGASVVTALPPSPMTPFTPMTTMTSATHAPPSAMSHLTQSHAAAAAACISPSSASSTSPPVSSPPVPSSSSAASSTQPDTSLVPHTLSIYLLKCSLQP